MQHIYSVLKAYKLVSAPVKWLVAAELALQTVNSAFFLLLNYYMDAHGYADYSIAQIVSYRFIAVMVLAFPLGLFIKGRKLKPFFMIAAITLPLMSLVVIESIQNQWDILLNISMVLWGIAFTCIQITALPFIMLNAKREYHSEAISMFFQTWSVSICLVGVVHFSINNLWPDFIPDKSFLQICSLLGLLAVYCISRIQLEEKVSESIPLRKVIRFYDWKAIAMVSMPTLIIAVGAGFSIPILNLFFMHVHDIPAKTYSIMGAGTYFMVAVGMTFMPGIRRRWGYQTAITGFQVGAVLALFIMATTEWYSHWWGAVYIAVFFFLIRQPLMNMVGPMTSELTMYYVGPKNQEIISALNSSIWSGSWFFSMQIFAILRSAGVSYVNILLITVGLYIVGVAWYYYLIRVYQEREVGSRS
jgi:hypothetical protein